MIGDYINLGDHSTAQLVARAVERAEADAHSCVVRHAQVEQTHRTFWRQVEAKRQAAVTPARVLKMAVPR
jgi:hypothetical protein